MDTTTPASEHVVVERSGAIVTVTFNRPEARNAMTWAMYERLHEVCEEVDPTTRFAFSFSRVPAARRSSPAPTSPSSPTFESGDDGLRYERDGDLRSDRLARVSKPVIAQIEGYAVGGGLRHRRRRRPAHRDARRALRRADRAHARQLPVDARAIRATSISSGPRA